MKPIRLLPVVVLAIAAVLVLKTIGLVTHGGYVLTGVATARAEGEAGGHGAPAAAVGGDSTVTFPPEPTLTDSSPVMSDAAPTVGQTAAAGEHGAPEAGHGEAPAAAEGHGDAPAAAEGHGEAPAAAEGHGAAAANAEVAAVEATPAAPAVPDVAAAVTAADACVEIHPTVNALSNAGDAGEGHGAPAPLQPGEVALEGEPINPNCLPADAIPMQVDAEGNKIPLTDTAGKSLTDQVLLERLAARRDELQAYEQELTMRASLVDAAEKRIQERTAALETLESQIAGLVDQRKAMEDEQFAGIVAMYEAMKPKDAAAIFDTLEMDVLLRVAKAINSRKMAPIMAAMSSARAQELTVAMATVVTDPPEKMTPDNLAALPQIVGQ